MNRVFLDTDIIFDMFLERHPYYVSSMLVFEMAHKRRVELYVSSVCFTNLFYIMRKKYPFNRTMSYLKKLIKVSTVLSVDKGIIDSAIESGFNDFEDAVQYYTALNNNIEVILTRNISDYKKDDIPVMTAEQFLKAF